MINRFIDHTNLMSSVTEEDIITLCNEAKEYDFKAVCVPPAYVKTATEQLKDTRVRVCTVVGFPYGYNTTNTKIFEAMDACINGANEIDMVLNISKLKQNQTDYLIDEINAVKKAIKKIPLKVIIETALLTEEEKQLACEVINQTSANFIKSSTGVVKPGVTVDDIQFLKNNVIDGIEVKASSGIHTWDEAKAFIEVGATRIGTSHGVEIQNGYKAEENLQETKNLPIIEENDEKLDLFSDDNNDDFESNTVSSETSEVSSEEASEDINLEAETDVNL